MYTCSISYVRAPKLSLIEKKTCWDLQCLQPDREPENRPNRNAPEAQATTTQFAFHEVMLLQLMVEMMMMMMTTMMMMKRRWCMNVHGDA